MAQVKKTIGKLPVHKGAWVQGVAYARLNQVTHEGSCLQSKVDNNTATPLMIDMLAGTFTVHANWQMISDGTTAKIAAEKANEAATTIDERIVATDNKFSDDEGFIKRERVHPLQGKVAGVKVNKNGICNKVQFFDFNSSNWSLQLCYEQRNDFKNGGCLFTTSATANSQVGLYIEKAWNTSGLVVKINGANLFNLPISQTLCKSITLVKDGDSYTLYDNASNKGVIAKTAIISGSTLFGLGGFPVGSVGAFSDKLYKSRLFNYSLTDHEVNQLWNNGRPDKIVLSNDKKGSGENKCVAEYLASSLTYTQWRDTSGNGNHLVPITAPELIYTPTFEDHIIKDITPSVIPAFVGQKYTDKTAKVIYEAVGTTAVSDWVQISK